MIAIIDYGVGNLRSVEKAFGAVGARARQLRASGLDRLVLEAAEAGKPLLGLCVGLQLMFDEGHEFGVHRGLGLMRGRVVRFPEDGPRVPQIGWNQIEKSKAHPL